MSLLKRLITKPQVLALASVTVSLTHAADFQYDATGNLTNIQAAVAAKPSLPNDLLPMQVGLGEALSLTVPVQDAGLATYQWYRDGLAIAGATNQLLTLASITEGDSGVYSLAVTNAQGGVQSTVAQVTFVPRHEDFALTNDLNLAGNAFFTNGSLRLTPAVSSQTGSAWFTRRLFCQNGFTTVFQFRISNPVNGGADGFSFNIQNVASNALAGEDGLGASIKFDTWQSPGELGTNFVSVRGAGFPTTTVDLTPYTIVLDDGFPHTVELQHDGLNANLWVDGFHVVTNAPMPLEGALDSSGKAWVGFGARTGGAWENHDILSWEFTPRIQAEPVQVVVNPASQAAALGGSAFLTATWGSPESHAVTAGSTYQRGLFYEWDFNGMTLYTGTNATLALTNVQTSQAGSYSVTVMEQVTTVGPLGAVVTTNLLGSATNTLAVLQPITNLFNTGLDNNRAPLPDGSVDPHYRLITNPDSSSTNALVQDSTAFPLVSGPWLSNTVSSKWVGPRLNTASALGGTYVYRSTFDLTGVDVTRFRVLGRWSSDNQGVGLVFNGTPSLQANATEFSAYSQFSFSSGFLAGLNAIDFVVTNTAPGYTGLRVEMAGAVLVTNSSFTGDSDMDGLPDAWEYTTFGNLWQDQNGDYDGDGVSNRDELIEGTDPANPASFRPRLTTEGWAACVTRTPGKTSYQLGETVQLTAVPMAGARFLGWGGDVSGTNLVTQITLTNHARVSAMCGYPFVTNGIPVPGVVQAEDFDNGGESFSYHDTDQINNAGATYREGGVDIGLVSGTNYKVSWTDVGEWLHYTINVASNGYYRVVLRTTSANSGPFRSLIEFPRSNGADLITTPGTGGWGNWISTTGAVLHLEAGLQLMRFTFEDWGYELDSITLLSVIPTAPTVAITAPLAGTTFGSGVDVNISVSAADLDGIVKKVELFTNGVWMTQFLAPPYTTQWHPPAPGTYAILARAVDEMGLAGTSAPATILVSSNVVSGGLKAEYFMNINGGAIADLTNDVRFLAGAPDLIEQTTQFESRRDWADNYGARLSGWLIPPTTGNYLFYLASDDQSVLFLSTDASPANKQAIAFEPAWNGYREFVNGANQASRGNPPVNISTNIPLVAGQAYYVEALLKEAIYGENLSVAWLPPGGPAVANGAAPIPGKYLVYGAPYVGAFQPITTASLTNSGQIGVSFGRFLDLATATATTNYQVLGATVTGATLSPDRQGVLLNVSGLAGSSFTVQVGAVKDLFGNSTPASTSLTGQVLPQARQDVGSAGDPAVAGATYSSLAGDFDVVAGGSDIWNSADAFHFVYQPLTGDFDVKVRVGSLEAVNRWAKAGLMVREDLTGGSRELGAVVTPVGPTFDGQWGGQGNNDYELLLRPGTGQPTMLWTTNSDVANVPYPNAWVRLKRTGSNFSGFRSSDGITWTQLGQTNQSYPSTVFVGLATTAHNNTAGYTALARYHDYGMLGVDLQFTNVSAAGTIAYYPTDYPPSALPTNRVGNVTMNLTGDTNLSVSTLGDGSYGLSNIAARGTYCITPSKTDDSAAANGVTVADLAMIQAQVLGKLHLGPYQLLAADVNTNGSITVADLALIQAVILAKRTNYPAGLWRFVPADYVFPDPNSPWNALSQRWYTNQLADVTSGDFFAIKLGDVNHSWKAAASSGGQSLVFNGSKVGAALAAAVPEVVFGVDRQSAQPGRTVTVGVTVSGFHQVTSAQFSLAWDPAVLRYVGTGSYGLKGLSAGSFGTTLVESGKLAFAWYDQEAVGVTLADGTVLFTVSFEVIGKAGSVSPLALAGTPTAPEVGVDFGVAAFGAQNASVTVVGPGVLVTKPVYANGAFRLSVATEKGRSYTLEFSDSLTPGEWKALPAVAGDGTVTVLVDPAAINQQRFYRVRVQ
jgi:hypothetical protein